MTQQPNDEMDLFDIFEALGFEVTHVSEGIAMYSMGEKKKEDNAPEIDRQGYNVLARMFEPYDYVKAGLFVFNDEVVLTRPTMFQIPVGCKGIITTIEEPESAMYSKGRPFYVMFDLEPYKIPLDPVLVEFLKRNGQEPPEYYLSMGTNVGPSDIDLVDREEWKRREDALVAAVARRRQTNQHTD